MPFRISGLVLDGGWRCNSGASSLSSADSSSWFPVLDDPGDRSLLFAILAWVAENEIPGWQVLKQMIDIEDGPSTAGDALPEGHRLEELRVYILSNF